MLRTNLTPGTAAFEAQEAARGALANLLFGAYRHRVLSLLFLRPGGSFHVRMISRLTGVPAGSLHRELRQLADAGLLRAERIGNQIHYMANEASPVFRELAAMLDKTAGAPPMLDDHSAEHSIEMPAKSKPKRKARSRARPARS
jgi:DNA-binding transcriptional ArsR family regulator